MKTVIYKLQAGLMRGLYACLAILPISWSSGLAKAVGWCFPYVAAKKRVLNNLQITQFKPKCSDKTFLRQVGTHCTHLFLDYAHIKYYAKSPKVWPLIEGDTVLDAVKNAGKGAIFVTAHLANWEMIRFAARARGVEIAMIYRSFNNPFADSYAFELAGEAGQPVFRKGAQGLREMIKHIRSGKSVLILVDQRSGGAPKLNFMGKPAETSLAAAELALKFKVPLIPCYARRDENVMSQFSVFVEPPIDQNAPDFMMQDVNNRIGYWIKQAPEQWFWVHNRWKTR